MLLVTGGGGFVMGHVVCRWLVQHSETQVLVVDTLPMDVALQHKLGASASRVEWIQGDVRNLDSLIPATHFEQIEFVVHGAAVTSISHRVHADGPGKPGLGAARTSVLTNIDGALAVLGLIPQLPNLMRVVNVSSGSVYASASEHQPLPEDQSVAPEDLYAISKRCGEDFVEFARRELDAPVVSVRLSGVFGPLDRETPSRAVSCVPKRFANALAEQRELSVRSLDAAGDFIHADDVADAILALLDAAHLSHPVYNVAAGELSSLRHLAAYAAELDAGFAVRETGDSSAEIDYEAHRTSGRWGAYDVSRIPADTGWSPGALRERFQSYVLEYKKARMDV